LALAPDVERARQTVIKLSAKFPETADFTADFTIFTRNGFSPRRNRHNLSSTFRRGNLRFPEFPFPPTIETAYKGKWEI
jgi:hypothetical protein